MKIPSLSPDRASVPLFWTLLAVEVTRQHSFWITVLGDTWTNQLVAIGSAAAMSGAQWMMAHILTTTIRDLLSTSYSRRDLLSRVLTVVLPIAVSWLLVVAAVTTLTTADIAIRLHESQKATNLLLSTGLSEESAAALLAIWSTLVTLALIAALTAIGIHTADSADERQADVERRHELELDRLLADRNHYQDLYNTLTDTSNTPSPQPSHESNDSSNLSPAPAQSGPEPESNGPSKGPSPESNASSNDDVLINIACPHCD